jgi:hypothetical protein
MRSICLPRLARLGTESFDGDLQSAPRLERETRSVSVGSTNEKQLLNSKVMGSSKKLTLLCIRAERHTSSWIAGTDSQCSRMRAQHHLGPRAIKGMNGRTLTLGISRR